jgi:hypothetical protein
MPYLTRSLAAFEKPEFEAVLREELAALGPDALGLQQALSAGNTALSDGIGIMILRSAGTSDPIRVRAGVFFKSILGGCACADDPTPENENAEYCEIDIIIDRRTAEAQVRPARA